MEVKGGRRVRLRRSLLSLSSLSRQCGNLDVSQPLVTLQSTMVTMCTICFNIKNHCSVSTEWDNVLLKTVMQQKACVFIRTSFWLLRRQPVPDLSTDICSAQGDWLSSGYQDNMQFGGNMGSLFLIIRDALRRVCHGRRCQAVSGCVQTPDHEKKGHQNKWTRSSYELEMNLLKCWNLDTTPSAGNQCCECTRTPNKRADSSPCRQGLNPVTPWRRFYLTYNEEGQKANYMSLKQMQL
jgi:hypothetical protein